MVLAGTRSGIAGAAGICRGAMTRGDSRSRANAAARAPLGTRRVGGREDHDQTGGHETSEPLRPAEPTDARQRHPAVADHVDGLGHDRDEDDGDRHPDRGRRATRTITSTITDSVSRLVNASPDRGRVPLPRWIDPGPRRRAAERRRAIQTRQTGTRRDRGQGEERREQPRRGSCACRVHPINLLPTTCGRPGRRSGRPCSRAHGAPCARADPAPVTVRPAVSTSSGDRDPVADDVDRGDPAVEVVGVEQARCRGLDGGAVPVRGRCRSAHLAVAAGRRCRLAARRTGPPGTRSTARRRDPIPPDRRHVPAR